MADIQPKPTFEDILNQSANLLTLFSEYTKTVQSVELSDGEKQTINSLMHVLGERAFDLVHSSDIKTVQYIGHTAIAIVSNKSESNGLADEAVVTDNQADVSTRVKAETSVLVPVKNGEPHRNGKSSLHRTDRVFVEVMPATINSSKHNQKAPTNGSVGLSQEESLKLPPELFRRTITKLSDERLSVINSSHKAIEGQQAALTKIEIKDDQTFVVTNKSGRLEHKLRVIQNSSVGIQIFNVVCEMDSGGPTKEFTMQELMDALAKRSSNLAYPTVYQSVVNLDIRGVLRKFEDKASGRVFVGLPEYVELSDRRSSGRQPDAPKLPQENDASSAFKAPSPSIAPNNPSAEKTRDVSRPLSESALARIMRDFLLDKSNFPADFEPSVLLIKPYEYLRTINGVIGAVANRKRGTFNVARMKMAEALVQNLSRSIQGSGSKFSSTNGQTGNQPTTKGGVKEGVVIRALDTDKPKEYKAKPVTPSEKLSNSKAPTPDKVSSAAKGTQKNSFDDANDTRTTKGPNTKQHYGSDEDSDTHVSTKRKNVRGKRPGTDSRFIPLVPPEIPSDANSGALVKAVEAYVLGKTLSIEFLPQQLNDITSIRIGQRRAMLDPAYAQNPDNSKRLAEINRLVFPPRPVSRTQKSSAVRNGRIGRI